MINNLGRRIEEDKDQQHHGIGQQERIGIRLRADIERHEREPEDETHADDIPKVVTEAAPYILDRQGAGVGDRLFDEAQRRPYEQGVDRAEQEAAGHPQGGGDLLGKHEEEHEADDGYDRDPAPQEGQPGLAKGFPVKFERRCELVGHRGTIIRTCAPVKPSRSGRLTLPAL